MSFILVQGMLLGFPPLVLFLVLLLFIYSFRHICDFWLKAWLCYWTDSFSRSNAWLMFTLWGCCLLSVQVKPKITFCFQCSERHQCRKSLNECLTYVLPWCTKVHLHMNGYRMYIFACNLDFISNQVVGNKNMLLATWQLHRFTFRVWLSVHVVK